MGEAAIRKVLQGSIKPANLFGAKLTDSQVADIRRRYSAGGTTKAALGRLYGVSGQAIYNIIVGRAHAA